MNTINPQKVIGADKTLLPMSQVVNWLPSYEIGYGVNAVTGEVTPLSALKPFECKPVDNFNVHKVTTLIHDESSYAKEFNASEKTGFNFEGVGVSQSADYLSKVNFSSVTSTLVSHKTIVAADFDKVNSSSLSLTDDAQSLLDNSSAEFREKYGDYFVQSEKGGSSLTVLVICSAQTTEDLKEFNQKASVGFVDLFSVKEQTQLSELAKSYNISLSYEYSLVGVNEISPSFKSIDEAESWFDEHHQLVPVTAYLTSYAELSDQVQRDIDVPGDVFVKIITLYEHAALLSSLHNSCQAPYNEALEEPYSDFVTNLKVNSSQLATNPDKLQELLDESNYLIGEYQFHANCYGFFCDTKHEASLEPSKGHENSVSQRKLFQYGTNSNTLPFNTGDKKITVYSCKQHCNKDWKVGRQDHSFDLINDDTQFIIGWSVRAKKNDDGYWEKLDDQILTTGRYQVYVKSDYDRGIDYDAECFYVSREYFNYK